MDVTVVVATFGDESWIDMAEQRAIPSAESHRVPVVHCHGIDLMDARNFGLKKVDTEWVCFLDADDELEPGYFDHMTQATADLRVPAVRYIRDGRERPARFPRVAGHLHDCTAECLPEGNWLVIGTVARADMIRSVGGFRDFSWSEDWDLWVRCWKNGATVERVAGSVYRAHVRPDSRNRAGDRETRLEVHRAIARANQLPVPA